MTTCLIADDAPIVRKVAARILELNDFAVEGVEATEDMMRALRDTMPDLIIVSERLGETDGIALATEIRGLRGGKLPTILICAAENGIGLRSKVRRSGANGVLLKPFTRQTIEAQLGRLGLTRALAA